MLANDETIKSFALVNQQLNEIYASEDGDDVLIPEDSKRELFQSLSEFASQCRLDLGISDRDVEEKLVQDAVETLTNTGKKGRDYSKKSFNGKMFAKNRYVWEVLSNHVNENPNMTLTEFAELLPRDGGDEFKRAGLRRTGTYDTWKKYEEAVEALSEQAEKRFWIGKDKEMLLNLDGDMICVSRAWATDQMTPFVERMKSKGIKTE